MRRGLTLVLALGAIIAGLSVGPTLAQSAGPRPLAALAASGGPALTGRVLVADRDRILSDERAGAYGAANVWPWGSVSKQVAAALVMIEVDRKTLSLDDTIASRWKAFPNAATVAVTVRQLLRHTSGLPNPDDTPEIDGIPAFYLRRDAGATPSNADATGFCAGPARNPPETRFEYNNCDTLVLAGVLEAATGKSYGRLLAEAIAQPLHLASLRLARPQERPIIARANGEAVLPVNLAVYGAAGGLLGSPEDLVRFDQALLAQRLVSPASTAVMWTGDPAIRRLAMWPWGRGRSAHRSRAVSARWRWLSAGGPSTGYRCAISSRLNLAGSWWFLPMMPVSNSANCGRDRDQASS